MVSQSKNISKNMLKFFEKCSLKKICITYSVSSEKSKISQLNVVILNVIMLTVVTMSVIMLSAVMLNVIMLNLVLCEPCAEPCYTECHIADCP